MYLNLHVASYTKTNLEWLNDLNHKISRKNIGQIFYDPQVRQRFLSCGTIHKKIVHELGIINIKACVL